MVDKIFLLASFGVVGIATVSAVIVGSKAERDTYMRCEKCNGKDCDFCVDREQCKN